MADEAAVIDGGTPAGTETASPEPTGQGVEGAEGSGASSDGQGTVTPPVEGQEKAAPGETGEGETDKKPQWDPETSRWMQSKGYDVAAFDPSNEAHSSMVASHREAERGLTQRQQSERTKEVLERVKTAQPAAKGGEEELSPSQVVDRDYDAVKEFAFNLLGVADMAELQREHPDTAAQLQSEYDKAWKDGIKADLKWENSEASAATKAAEEQQRFRDDFDQARRQSESVVAGIRAKNPQYDQHMKDSGVDKFLSLMEEKFQLWPELLNVDPKIAGFFSDAAEAIEYRKSEPERAEKWKQDYEKDKMELAKATGPRPAGGGGSPHPAFVVGGSWDKTLESVATKVK